MVFGVTEPRGPSQPDAGGFIELNPLGHVTHLYPCELASLTGGRNDIYWRQYAI